MKPFWKKLFLQLSRHKTAVAKNDEPGMKFLYVGLGNMGVDYEYTRHNIGFQVVDHLAEAFKCTWEHEHLGDLCDFKYKGRRIYLLKPSTFMNRSGKSVRYWMQKLKINQKNVVVVVDDIQLPLGKLRMRKKGSHGGHNGLKDIESMLATHHYPRLRIGIGSEFYPGQQVDYVLGQWSVEEKKLLPEIFENSQKMLLSYCTIGAERTMSEFN